MNRSPEHVEEAHQHIECTYHVVDYLVVAVDAKAPVDTIVSDWLLAVFDRICAHGGPTEQESAKPHIEDKHEVGVAV